MNRRQRGERDSKRWLRSVFSYRTIGYIVILAAMGLFGVKFGQQVLANHQKALEVQAATLVVNQEQSEIRRYQKELKAAKSPGFIQENARLWGYVKQGENLVSLNYKPAKRVKAHHHRIMPKPAKPVWQQWWNAFFR